MSLEDRLYPLLSLYERSPQWMRSTVGTAYRQLPHSMRQGSSYAPFKRLIEQQSEWSTAEIENYQLEQLRHVIELATHSSPFYADLYGRAGLSAADLQHPSDIAKFPSISKQDVIEHRDAMASSDFSDKDRLYLTTGGSTGVPVGFYLHKGISRPKEKAFLDSLWARAGYNDGDPVLVLRGQVTTERADGKIWYYDAIGNRLNLSASHLTNDRMPEYLERIRAFKPKILFAFPSSALDLAKCLNETGESLGVELASIVCTSERLEESQKRLLEETYKTRVYQWYGHTERAVLAGQGATSDLYYFFPFYGYTEFGEADDEGRQEVIATTFHNEVMPLIRYRTGDYVSLYSGPEEDKEFPWPAATAIRGREQEYLISHGGRKISLSTMNMHDDIFDGLVSIQFFQDTVGEATFRYIVGSTFDPDNLDRIHARIQSRVGDDFIVTMEEATELEKTLRGKHRWVITELVD